MEFPSLAAVLTSLIVLVPGYIIYSTVAVITVRRSEEKELMLLRFAAFSALNLIPWLPFLHRLQGMKWDKPTPQGLVINLIIIIFLSPAAIGLLIGAADRVDLLKRVLSCLRLSPLHPIPTAWDFKFSNLSRNNLYLIQVTTTSGEFYCGVFGNRSLASSDKDERDIYLETLLRIEGGEWKPIPDSEGLLIRGSEIRTLEFFRLPNDSIPTGNRFINFFKRMFTKR